MFSGSVQDIDFGHCVPFRVYGDSADAQGAVEVIYAFVTPPRRPTAVRADERAAYPISILDQLRNSNPASCLQEGSNIQAVAEDHVSIARFFFKTMWLVSMKLFLNCIGN